jgi:anti-sigma factor RsiW
MNQTCTTLRAALLDRADGRATPDQARAVDEHLATCAACRDLADKLGAAPQLPALEVPPALFAEMRADLHARLDDVEALPQGDGWWSWLFRGSFAIPKPFAWAAVAVLVLLWMGRLPAQQPPPPVLMEGVDRLGLADGTAQG